MNFAPSKLAKSLSLRIPRVCCLYSPRTPAPAGRGRRQGPVLTCLFDRLIDRSPDKRGFLKSCKLLPRFPPPWWGCRPCSGGRPSRSRPSAPLLLTLLPAADQLWRPGLGPGVAPVAGPGRRSRRRALPGRPPAARVTQLPGGEVRAAAAGVGLCCACMCVRCGAVWCGGGGSFSGLAELSCVWEEDAAQMGAGGSWVAACACQSCRPALGAPVAGSQHLASHRTTPHHTPSSHPTGVT